MKKFYNSFKTENLFLNILIIILWSPIFLILGIIDLIIIPIKLIKNKNENKKEKIKETKQIKIKEKPIKQNLSELETLNKKLKIYKIVRLTEAIITSIAIIIFIPIKTLLSLIYPINIILNIVFCMIIIPNLITTIIFDRLIQNIKIEIAKKEIIEAIKDSK